MENQNNKYSTRAIALWLWKTLKGNRRQAIFNATLGLLQVAVSLLSVWAVQRAIDTATGNIEGSIYWAVAVMGGLIIADFGINISQVWIRNILGVRAQNLMQRQLVARLLSSEWYGLENRHSGDVTNRLEQDVKTVVEFLTETLPSALSTSALFIGAFFYMFSMDSWLALVIAGMIPIFILFSRIYISRMRRLTREVRSSDSRVQSIMQETVQRRTLIKTLEGDSMMVDRLGGEQTILQKKVQRRTIFSLISHLILNFGFALGYLVAFLWAALRMSGGTLSFGGMTAFLQLVNRIQTPARNLMRLAPAFVGVFTAAERLMELEENPLEEQGEPQPMASPCGIKLTNMSYGYNDREVLRNLSFDFKPGTCTAITGPTGSGKTTLFRLMLALIKPHKGIIKIYEGTSALPPLGELEGASLSPLHRCNFVYVPQGNTLMSGSIRDNLLLANSEATEEMMIESLKKSCADFVLSLPEGLDTLCNEQGGGLSEGQCQRISIARALLRQRPIMLFDEATSALDPETERQVLNNILSDNSHTIIFITHRPAALAYCHQTLELK